VVEGVDVEGGMEVEYLEPGHSREETDGLLALPNASRSGVTLMPRARMARHQFICLRRHSVKPAGATQSVRCAQHLQRRSFDTTPTRYFIDPGDDATSLLVKRQIQQDWLPIMPPPPHSRPENVLKVRSHASTYPVSFDYRGH